MKQKDIHCREVQELINGKTPFMTRFGIILIIIISIIIALLVCNSNDMAKTIINNILSSTVEHLKISTIDIW